MKLHYLQHVAFEGLGQIEAWAQCHNIEISCTHLFSGDELVDAPFIQNINPMRDDAANMPIIHAELDKLLRMLLRPPSKS